jgi:hypothetical protein
VALLGGASATSCCPSLVKRHFPDRIGPMTAVYTTALAVGLTGAAAGAVPLADAAGEGGWRFGLGAWALLSALAVVPWLWHVAERGGSRRRVGGRSGARMLGSRTAWALAGLLRRQSLHAYVSFGWFALFFQEQGPFSASHAGFLLAVVTGLSIPVSAVVPALAARRPSQRPIVLALAGCYVVAYTGMLTATDLAGGVLWAALVGVGSGAFPLALTMIALRTRTGRRDRVAVGVLAERRLPARRRRPAGRRCPARPQRRLDRLVRAAVRRPGRHGGVGLVRRAAALRRGRGALGLLDRGRGLGQRLERLREALRRRGHQPAPTWPVPATRPGHAGVDLRQDAGARDLQHVDARSACRGSRAPGRRTPGSRRA